MGDQRLILDGDKAYLVDFSKFKMFEMMPMVIPPPVEPKFRVFLDLIPCLMVPRAVFIGDAFYEDDPWKFMFLFPLGRRGHVKRK